ncbi:MAG: hypothetical protein GY950_35045 [bacterium]|nr:hypothetical protein [bacterium]
MSHSQVFLEFEKSVQERYPSAEIYTFTPKAAGKGSLDFNVLVVLDEVNSITYETVFDIACEIGTKHEMFLSPLLTKKESRPLYLPHFF